jgi:soluble lytic murein transglycosylase-like protein
MRLYVAQRKAFDVYQRAKCGDWRLAGLTAEWAVRRRLPAEVVAAQVSIESECNPRAKSSDGSIGLMQVRIETWRRVFKFEPKEMLEAGKSLEVGTEILRLQVARYGLRKGIERYNGKGPKARRYAAKVLRLAMGDMKNE